MTTTYVEVPFNVKTNLVADFYPPPNQPVVLTVGASAVPENKIHNMAEYEYSHDSSFGWRSLTWINN